MAFRYYGAKNQLARWYQFPRYGIIVEPFAGSAGYSMFHLERDKSLRALLCDKCHEVIEAWKWLMSHSISDILNYPLPNLGEASSDFFIRMCSVSNAAFGCSKMKVTKRMADDFPRMIQRLVRLKSVMPRIEVVEASYETLPDIEATWFVDPPYQIREGSSINGDGYAKGCRASDMNFEALGDWVKSRRGQVIVCEKMGADWLPFKPFRMATNSLDTKYCEVVWNSMPNAQMEFDF